MSTLIIGASGSMGKRYQAILAYLQKPFTCVDVDAPLSDVKARAWSSKGVIIATPTDTHCTIIKQIARPDIPILCEKPISTDMLELAQTLEWIAQDKINLTMMYQYKLLDQEGRTGHSHYNYFKHGNDGLFWDAMQTISIARTGVFVGEDSPIWKCRLNGRVLDIGMMDVAYVNYVSNWYEKPGHDLKMLLDIHLKTDEYRKNGSHERNYSNSSKINVKTLS